MFSSEFVISPGTLVKNFLERNNISKKDVVSKTNLSATDLDKIFNCRMSIDSTIANELSKVSKKEASYFSDMQSRYDREISYLRY